MSISLCKKHYFKHKLRYGDLIPTKKVLWESLCHKCIFKKWFLNLN